MNAAFEQYKVEPHPWWKAACYSGMDGYEVMGAAKRRGWHEVPHWGSKRWNLGSWPYVVIYFRTGKEGFQVAEYCEGDVSTYTLPTAELREQFTNELAFYHWKLSGEEDVEAYETFEDLPDEFKGPYRR